MTAAIVLGSTVMAGGDVAPAPMVPADSWSGFYIGAEGGMGGFSFSSGGYNTIGNFNNTGDFNELNGFYGLSIGFKQNEKFRYDLTWHHYKQKAFVTNSFRPPTPTFFYRGTLKVDTLLLNLYYTFATIGQTEIYGGIGMGVTHVHVKHNDYVVGTDDSDNVFTWMLETGLNYHINNSWTIYSGIRFVDPRKANMKMKLNGTTVDAGNYTLNLKSKEAFIGLRFRF